VAIESKIYGGFLYQRKIDKLVGGGRIDWNSGPVLRKIEGTVAAVNSAAARRIERVAKMFVPVKSGDLKDTIKAYPSKYNYSGSVGLGRKVYSEWVVSAGNEEVDYARSVEVGWAKFERDSGGQHIKDAEGKNIFMHAAKGKGFMRKAAANARKWTRREMISRLRAAIK
jgi:hypothetical protein